MAAIETLIVHVVDETGRPVAGAFVTVDWGTAPTPEITLLTDAEGRARLGLPTGRFRIRAAAPGDGEGTSEVDVPGPSMAVVVQLIRKL
jgi:carboxypeptidase family protein